MLPARRACVSEILAAGRPPAVHAGTVSPSALLQPAAVAALLFAAPAASGASADALPTALTTVDGAALTAADLAGRVVVVAFWATWCAPCRVELPELDAYLRRHAGDGLVVVAVSLDAGASAARLRRAAAAWRFPVARIDNVRLPRAAIPTALPTTRVYDRQGVLRFDSGRPAERGPLDLAALERIVTPLLADATTR